MLLDAVPGGAAKVVTGPLFDTLTSALQGQLAKLSQPKFFRYALIEHHGNATLPSKVCDDLDLTFNPDDFPAPPTSGPYAPDAVTVRDVDASTPGLEDGTACDVTTYVPGPGDGYQCSATVNCQPLGYWDLLDYTSDDDAKKAYTEIVDNGEFSNSTPIGGIGDQAAVTTGGGIVRVERLNHRRLVALDQVRRLPVIGAGRARSLIPPMARSVQS